MPLAGTRVMKREEVLASPTCAGTRANNPVTRGAVRAGLDQCAGSGRIGLGQKCPPGERGGECLVMDPRRQLRWRYAELGRKIDGGATAQAVAAAPKPFVVLMLMMR